MPRVVPQVFAADQSACQECAIQSLSFPTSCSKSLDEISSLAGKSTQAVFHQHRRHRQVCLLRPQCNHETRNRAHAPTNHRNIASAQCPSSQMAIHLAKMGILPASANALKNHLGGSPRNRPLNTCCDSFFSGSKFALMPRGNQPIRIGRERSPNIIQCREFFLDRHLIYRIFHHRHSLVPSLYASYYSIISHADESSHTIRAIKTAAHRPRKYRAAASRSLSCPRRSSSMPTAMGIVISFLCSWI